MTNNSEKSEPDKRTYEEMLYLRKMENFLGYFPLEHSLSFCNLIDIDTFTLWISRIQLCIAGGIIIMSVILNILVLYYVDLVCLVSIFSTYLTMTSVKNRQYKHAYDGYKVSQTLLYGYYLTSIIYTLIVLMQEYDPSKDSFLYNQKCIIFAFLFDVIQTIILWYNYSYVTVLIITHYKVVSTSKDQTLTEKRISFESTLNVSGIVHSAKKEFMTLKDTGSTNN